MGNRKKRKQKRKNAQAMHEKQKATRKWIEETAKKGAVIMTKYAIIERNKKAHLLHKIVLTKKREKGCYDAFADIVLCKTCYWKNACNKWDCPKAILKEEEDEKENYRW